MPPKRNPPKSSSDQKPKRKPFKKGDHVPKVVTKAAVRRLARRGGVKRFASLILPEIRTTMATFVTKLVTDAMAYADHGRRTTVTAHDVLYALRHRNVHLYGYN